MCCFFAHSLRNAPRRQPTSMLHVVQQSPVPGCSDGVCSHQDLSLVSWELACLPSVLPQHCQHTCHSTRAPIKRFRLSSTALRQIVMRFPSLHDEDVRKKWMFKYISLNGCLNTYSCSWCVVTCNIFLSSPPSRFFQFCCAPASSYVRFSRNSATWSCLHLPHLEYIKCTCSHMLILSKWKLHRCM